MRWCWVNFQYRGVLLIWIRVGQGPTALAVGAGGGCLDIFILIYHFSFLSSPLWETTRYRLKYCLKGSLSPKQPTNQSDYTFIVLLTLFAFSTNYIELLKALHKKNIIDFKNYNTKYSQELVKNPQKLTQLREMVKSILVGRPGTGRLPSTIAPPDHPKYRLKYCLKGPLSPKTTNQPTNQTTFPIGI